MTALGSVRRRLVGIPSAQAVFSRPGFAPEAWQRFAPVAEALVAGYHATLEDSALPALVPRLEAVDPDFRGFAYEGAGMGLGALDLVAPWKRRLPEFVEGPGGAHVYPVYIGLGLALAHLHRRPEKYLDRLDPLLGWIIVDGYGFHGGFFSRNRYIVGKARPANLSPYGTRLFDQGLGRAIWFSGGAVVEQVARTIGGFQPDRHADLWSGVGMASAYGGGTDRAGFDRLREIASDFRAQLARGAATAAWGRQLAGHQAAHTNVACEVFCGTSDADSARTMDDARRDLPDGTPQVRHEAWIRRVESTFAPT